MRKTIINIALIAIISFSHIAAGGNNIILGGGINHRFTVNSVTQTNLSNYSFSFQYSRSISDLFSIGIKGIMDNLKIMNESSIEVERIQTPLLITFNHNLLAGLSNIYTQLGGGIVVDYGNVTSEEQFDNYNTGYCIALATGFTFELLSYLGGNFEIGLTFQKFKQNIFRDRNSQIKTNIHLGILLDF